jgi:nitric oxide reductase NorE protein
METKQTIYPPGDFGIWLIIYIELITFGGLFLGYAFSRRNEVELFNASQTLLNSNLGLMNTLFLISSSFCVVKAVEYAKTTSSNAFDIKKSQWLLLALVFAALFLCLKGFEFTIKYEQGIHWGVNTFFMFYYMLTVFHFLHVLLGTVILYIMYKKMNQGEYHAKNILGLESGASYWHMVDLLWIVLFPLVYILH